MSLSLPAQLAEELHKAVLASLPTEGKLRVWVQFKLGQDLNELKKSESTLPELVLDLFKWVEGQQKWRAFVEAGIEVADPDYPLLRAACERIRDALSSP